MTGISGSNFADSLRWQKQEYEVSEEGQNGKAMSQQDFFSLLTTQLAQQDPTKPQDNNQMIAQMTNFTMADGISNLQKQFEGFANNFGGFTESMQSQQTSNKALQASSMVGREVLVESGEAPLFQLGEESYGMAGQVLFDGAYDDIKVKIKDAGGHTFKIIDLASANSGPLSFVWDGKDSDGNQMPANVYKIEAVGIDKNTGKRMDMTTATYSTVDSVRFGKGNDLSMNLRGIGVFSIDDIIEVAP
jgi:flagellar basal-body rod modification protein FlgD